MVSSKAVSFYNIFTFLKPESVQITDIRYLTMMQKQIRYTIGMISLIHIICSFDGSAAEATLVAQLDNVPGWLRTTLARIFKYTIKFSGMMDWTGDVFRAYEYTSGKANVVIISRQGYMFT